MSSSKPPETPGSPPSSPRARVLCSITRGTRLPEFLDELEAHGRAAGDDFVTLDEHAYGRLVQHEVVSKQGLHAHQLTGWIIVKLAQAVRQNVVNAVTRKLS